jgi:hypothetical protein
MSRSQAVLGWLEEKSDWLNPIVVKEIRQVARGREFAASFAASLVAGVGIAFFGAADALTGSGTSGSWTFAALMACLALLGLAVVPLGAFNALRLERTEQTLELMTLTALSSRRVVIGKLLAQGVKLATLFAVMAPFIAMSFLLGGIDFVTIVVSLLVLFGWSLWACAVFLFVSTLLTSRAISGIVLGAMAILLFLRFGLGRSLFLGISYGITPVAGVGGAGSAFWWALAITGSFCLVSLVNLVLLAENRLSPPTENRTTPLRVGFLVQFLLIAGWALAFIDQPARVRPNPVEVLGVVAGLHLAVVALFTVTEDLVVPRQAVLRVSRPAAWRGLLAMFYPGGGRGALYVLAQMALLLVTAWLFDPPWLQLRWLLAICGYICFFTGVPTLAFRLMRPESAASFKLRVAVLLLVPLSMVLPDVIYYVLWRPDVLDLRFSARHLVNPMRTLANWPLVETSGWLSVPLAMGLAGALSYLGLMRLGMFTTVQPVPVDPEGAAAAAGEPGNANVIY